MSVWAIMTDTHIITPSILCGEHALRPEVLDWHWKHIQENGTEGIDVPVWQQLHESEEALAKECVECYRLEGAAAQPLLLDEDAFPSPTSPETTEADPEQDDWETGEAEEDPEYVREKMDGVAPVPFYLDIVDKQTDEAENGIATSWVEPMVQLDFHVVETVTYPASVLIPKRRYEELLALFPQLKRHNLPLGLMLQLARAEGARVVVDEKHGNVQGQIPAEPVREGRTCQ